MQIMIPDHLSDAMAELHKKAEPTQIENDRIRLCAWLLLVARNRELVLEPVRCTGEDRGLAGGLQLATATLGAKVLDARRVRAEGRFAFFTFEYHTSGSASRLP